MLATISQFTHSMFYCFQSITLSQLTAQVTVKSRPVPQDLRVRGQSLSLACSFTFAGSIGGFRGCWQDGTWEFVRLRAQGRGAEALHGAGNEPSSKLGNDPGLATRKQPALEEKCAAGRRCVAARANSLRPAVAPAGCSRSGSRRSRHRSKRCSVIRLQVRILTKVSVIPSNERQGERLG